MTKKKTDNCEFCLGAKGGVPGNENIFNGVVVCDYCSVLMLKAKGGAKNIMPAIPTPLLPLQKQAAKNAKPQKKKFLVQEGPYESQGLVGAGPDAMEVIKVKDGF